jgi:hypothetical protein
VPVIDVILGVWQETDRAISSEVSGHSLNPSQEKALRMALSRKLSLIQGPPGKRQRQCQPITDGLRTAE